MTLWIRWYSELTDIKLTRFHCSKSDSEYFESKLYSVKRLVKTLWLELLTSWIKGMRTIHYPNMHETSVYLFVILLTYNMTDRCLWIMYSDFVILKHTYLHKFWLSSYSNYHVSCCLYRRKTILPFEENNVGGL